MRPRFFDRASATVLYASIVILLFAFPLWVDGARILAVGTMSAKSHWNFMRGVLGALTDAGHRVTVFTSFPDGDRENYTEVDISDLFPRRLEDHVDFIMSTFGGQANLLNNAARLSRTLCNEIHGDRRMLDALRRYGDGTDFDTIIVEPVWVDCASHMAAELRIPIIYLVPSPMLHFQERAWVGHVPNPATVSHIVARHAVPRTFVQRFGNAVLSAYSAIVIGYHEMLLGSAPYGVSVTVQPSVVFVNSHFATEAPRPVPSNVVYVGGVHLNDAKPIPNDILDFIEDSPSGVIVFTLGSTIKMSTLPEHIIRAFKEVFAQVPQKVLWKYESEMKDKPKNVMTVKWLPQRDILLHPKVKLFISHGGMSGVYEAIDAGVPVLGFPLYFDQPRNIENLVDAGMAISMELKSTSKDAFLKNILELINNEKYKKNANTASKIFKDRPMSPAQSVVYWTEYVIRHNGAPHLKSHALNLTWYQYFLLDVIAVVVITLFLVIFMISKMLKFFYEYLPFHKQKIYYKKIGIIVMKIFKPLFKLI